MAQEEKKPKDLGLKIGTKEEADWTRVKFNAEEEIRKSKISIILNELILKEAEKRIAEEKKKFKSMRPNYV